MLARFCLYGFLKNQRYFEPFLMLALLEKELSFFAIGVLIAIRDITVNLLEVPSGAVADLFGRRRVMVLAFAAYAVSFAVFASAASYAALCAAMLLFALGEAFRSGTHKALIFTWLRQQGRTEEKTKIYGVTRSWSKFGSAASAVIAAGLVFGTGSYSAVFLWSVLPCAINVINLASYPRSIDPVPDRATAPRTAGAAWTHVRTTLGQALRRRELRGVLLEAMGFEGLFRAAKDYLQPALVLGAVAWFGTTATDHDKNALLVGAVYFVLFLGAGVASRGAHRLAARAGGDDRGARLLWSAMASVLVAVAGSSALGLTAGTILGFVVLHLLQNLWRPITTSRIYSLVEESRGATILSVESQLHRGATIVLAPVFGWLVDAAAGNLGPAFAVAAVIALAFRLGPPLLGPPRMGPPRMGPPRMGPPRTSDAGR